uniref:Protein tyrosine phosphatase receptor type Na n=1 Tax=Salmo trutta TaxID=8032 RepID=A0A674AA08_SALTR
MGSGGLCVDGFWWVCVGDSYGLFGQCRTSKQDQVQYQVSVPVLKRMQEVLKQLTLQGDIFVDINNNHLFPPFSFLSLSLPLSSILLSPLYFSLFSISLSLSLSSSSSYSLSPLSLSLSLSSSSSYSLSPLSLSLSLSVSLSLLSLSSLSVSLSLCLSLSLSSLSLSLCLSLSSLSLSSLSSPPLFSLLLSLSIPLSPSLFFLFLSSLSLLSLFLFLLSLSLLSLFLFLLLSLSSLSLSSLSLSVSLFLFLLLSLSLSLSLLLSLLSVSLFLFLLLSLSPLFFSLLSISLSPPQRSEGHGLPHATRVREGSSGLVLTLVSMACVGGVVVVALTIACLRHHAQQPASGKLGLGPEGGPETHFDYQELCRQHMAAKTSLSRQEAVGVGAGGRRGTDTSRVSSVSSQFSDGPQHSPSSHSSTPSWSEEPAQSKMDISTGHMILAYMEDHLKNKDRLMKEWKALCSYQAEPSAVTVAQSESHLEKNRCPEFLPYDHSRVKLKADSNSTKEDYINASIIIDHDPRLPAYIATQGPLEHTIADFWQMVWENGCTVIVMMTALVEDGETQCVRYWPDEGSSLYHIYEVNLVSEHIWCKDFLVRSFYLKNVQTQETRTLTQFHLLSWPANGIPTSTRPLLDFRRKVNRCYRGRSCPIIVHCSDGTGRTGTYILIDMVLNRMAKGVKEIDIAATLEHIRDQRPSLVHTKDQFEFALTAVAEEVNAILKALPQ